MVNISCSTKFHSFHLAEQISKRNLLQNFFTVYHSKKNPFTAKFNGRKDSEEIDLNKIVSFPMLTPIYKFNNNLFQNNSLFDLIVAKYLASNKDYKIFIGWSGMSIMSLRQAKKDGKILILERGSSHIRYQSSILREEYSRCGLRFFGDDRIECQEEEEYELADFITVPSEFVVQSFIEKKIDAKKIFKNNFGASSFFVDGKPKSKKFIILYLGTLNIRKGLPYLFQALLMLKISSSLFEVHFIGHVNDELKPLIPGYPSNWQFFGHINHHELADYISPCSVAVHPSLEEGLSMVIPQMMACGVPVIATTNSGGADIIKDSVDGYIIPIRSPEAIAERLTTLFEKRDILEAMQAKAKERAVLFGSWDSYGDRYANFILSKIDD